MSGIVALALRHWKSLAIGAAGLVVAIAFLVLVAQRNSARSERDEALATVAQRDALISTQNAAIERLASEGREAANRAERALSEATAANQRDRGIIDSLNRSGQRVRGANEPCTTSGSLRNAPGL